MDLDTHERLDRQREYTSRDSDHDGRPPVGRWGHDPLLERLIRYHPELLPEVLAKNLERPDDPDRCAPASHPAADLSLSATRL